MEQKIIRIPIDKLYLWNENPREPIDCGLSEEEMISRIVSDNKSRWKIQKLLEEIGDYYDYSEIPIVVYENGKYIVLDGNRRIALIKCIQSPSLSKTFLNQSKIPESIKLMEDIPCNVCDKETALTSIERKHEKTGSWRQLERDYFSIVHRGNKQSIFYVINEVTKIIENNDVLNQGYVKDEVFTHKLLSEIGINVDVDKVQINSSAHSEKEILTIFSHITDAISKGYITTRNNRGKLKEVLVEKYQEMNDLLNKTNSGVPNTVIDGVPAPTAILEPEPASDIEQDISNEMNFGNSTKSDKKRRTQKTRTNDCLFGGDLILQKGKVNDFYLAIDEIYKSSKQNDKILPMVGMSLRLLLEIAARVDFEREFEREITKEDADIYTKFLKKIKNTLSQEELNFSTLTKSLIYEGCNFEAILHKYAHGEISYERGTILTTSIIVGNILKKYFPR